MRYVLVVIGCLLFAVPVVAQVYECNGLFQNEPCYDGGGRKVKDTRKDTPRSDPSVAQKDRKGELLRSLSFNYEVNSQIKRECDSLSYERCKQLIEDAKANNGVVSFLVDEIDREKEKENAKGGSAEPELLPQW